MLFAIDVGNTSINMGLFQGEKIAYSWRLMSGIDRSADEYGSLISSLLKHYEVPVSSIRGAVLCSVVPPLVPVFQEVCERYLNSDTLVIEPGIKTGLRLLVDNPRELGPDRVANAVAGMKSGAAIPTVAAHPARRTSRRVSFRSFITFLLVFSSPPQ